MLGPHATSHAPVDYSTSGRLTTRGPATLLFSGVGVALASRSRGHYNWTSRWWCPLVFGVVVLVEVSGRPRA